MIKLLILPIRQAGSSASTNSGFIQGQYLIRHQLLINFVDNFFFNVQLYLFNYHSAKADAATSFK
jgi:hypothetical protein